MPVSESMIWRVDDKRINQNRSAKKNTLLNQVRYCEKKLQSVIKPVR